MFLGCVLVEVVPWAAAVFDRLERRRCSLCHRPVWWPLHASPGRPPICVGALGGADHAGDQDSCFARVFVGVN